MVFFILNIGAKIRIGTPGQSDLQGHRPGDGKCFYLEVKYNEGRTRPEQHKFIDQMKETGALAGFARSVEDALKIVFPEEYE